MMNLTRAMTESIQKKYPLNESQEILKKSGDLVLEKTVEFDGTCYSVYKDWRTDPDGFGYGVHLDTFRTLEDAEDYFEKVKRDIKESLLKESKNYEYVELGRVGNVEYRAIIDNDTGEIDIGSIHPYDNSDYHWAVSKDGGKTYTIYIHSPGKKVKVFSDTQDGEFDGIVNELANLDKNISSKIDRT